MKVTVILTDRQRRQFELDSGQISDLVDLIQAVEPLEGKALFFQGKQLDEDKVFSEQGVPESGALIRVDEEETPINRRAKKQEQPAETNGDEDEAIRAMLGFSSFTSSKGSTHTDTSGVKISKKMKHRQYMNRRGGKDKPLAES